MGPAAADLIVACTSPLSSFLCVGAARARPWMLITRALDLNSMNDLVRPPCSLLPLNVNLVRGIFASAVGPSTRIQASFPPTYCDDGDLQESSYPTTHLTVKRDRRGLLRQRSPQPPESIRASSRAAVEIYMVQRPNNTARAYEPKQTEWKVSYVGLEGNMDGAPMAQDKLCLFLEQHVITVNHGPLAIKHAR
jgi:hypothetical protein